MEKIKQNLKSYFKGKNIVFVSLFVIFVSISPFSTRAQTISYTPSSPNVEQEINFTLNPSPFTPSGNILWDFGDGFSAPLGLTWIKSYTTAGTFTVTATFTDTSSVVRTAQTTITTTEKRRIEFSPANPRVNDSITFQAVNFNNPAFVKWDFGDGTIVPHAGIQGSWTQTHAYSNAGTYTVTAKDSSDSVHLFTAVVTVHPPPTL
ncbi:PKD domain-containing protein, partial [Acidobacteriota bacterium]